VSDNKLAEFFKALGHPTRAAIARELLKGKRCVSSIRALLKITQPNVSQHLMILRLSGLVECGRRGKTRSYYLKDPKAVWKIFKILGGI